MDSLKVFSCCIKSLDAKTGGFLKGRRNDYVYRLACICNRYGMPKGDFLKLAVSRFEKNDFTRIEIIASVESAYTKNNFEHSKYLFR